MDCKTIGQQLAGQESPSPAMAGAQFDRNWYAVFTVPQNEKSAVKHLEIREIESFCPTYETVRLWRNRQRRKLTLPLFPRYLFVHISPRERDKVLQSPGVLQIVGKKRESLPLAEVEIDWLRSRVCGQRIEPYRELVIGERVRIKSGVMQGVQGNICPGSHTSLSSTCT